jgi:hypothetical protein
MSTVFQVWNGIKRFRLLDSSRSRMMYKPILPTLFFFFWFEEILSSRKAYFVGPGEGVKSWLFQALTRNTCPNSNLKPPIQILNSLSSRYVSWKRSCPRCLVIGCKVSSLGMAWLSNSRVRVPPTHPLGALDWNLFQVLTPSKITGRVIPILYNKDPQ